MSRTKSMMSLFLLISILIAIPQIAVACDQCKSQACSTARCDVCQGACCAAQLVEKLVWVPRVITETRTRPVVTHKMEDREETYTVFKRVPKEQKFTKEVCYLEDKVETQTITKKQCKVVMNPGIRATHVDVPETTIEYRTPTCQCQRACTCADQSCAVCTGEPCPCTVTRLTHDIRDEPICRPQLVFEETTKDIFYCVKEPKKKTKVCAEETVMELQPIQKTRTVQVCVPKIEHQPYDVQVTKMFQQKVQCCQTCRK